MGYGRDWFLISHSRNESVIFDRSTGPPLSIASGSTGQVFVLEAISASGDVRMVADLKIPVRRQLVPSRMYCNVVFPLPIQSTHDFLSSTLSLRLTRMLLGLVSIP